MNHLATEAEADHEYAHNVGRSQPQSAWICSDRDAWYRNPFYTGPKVPHPDADFDSDEEYQAECARLNRVGPALPIVEHCDEILF